ncbi:PROTEIN PHOSPHATASE 2C [Salix purpurea]|uniref:PROTEIN PHOSPHATASE 2C n=1 Tax=Salix purpurea TaxID=77065 RepID=A0A9Q0T977_SALPP|nr:PROTEIN PHOSPHATASE 2C [Salix purpurea]
MGSIDRSQDEVADKFSSLPFMQEVIRIKNEHPDDNQCIVNDRVKGRLKVTRAFGAGFLKRPKLNDALLEMFRNEYIGTAPYVSCSPSLHHHQLCPRDQFLVLSSDGLYQYLTNQEVVFHVESFMEKFPDGDPAQHLIEELLSRAAKKAGMDFHELLDIPQGDRRKYHDDVTVMVISLEGRIWKSSGKYL